MDVAFSLGATADIASAGEVSADGDRTRSKLDGWFGGLNRHKGNRRRLPMSVNGAATGTYVLDFGSPNGGNLWWLVEVVITAADDRTAPAGTIAALYAGAPSRQVGAGVIDTPPLGALIRPAIAVPAVFTFAHEAFPIQDGENLFAVVYAPTTAVSVLSGVATIMELSSSAVSLNRT